MKMGSLPVLYGSVIIGFVASYNLERVLHVCS
jgi:hypothetical protein